MKSSLFSVCQHRCLGLFFLLLFLSPSLGEAFMIEEWMEVISGEDAQKIKTISNPPSKVWQEGLSGMKFIMVAGGCYKMGSPPRADGRDSDEQPVHSVCLSDFWIGKHEVTQAEWRTIMRSNPSKFNRGDHFPVERVSYDDAIKLAKRLTEQHNGRAVFSLPTEAQWEYVCREGGLRTTFPGIEDIKKIAWLKDNSSNATNNTGTRLPNRLGIYDMSGNVWEWVQDSYDRFGYGKHQASNPLYDGQGIYRGVRGGSWRDSPEALRCANRGFSKFSEKRSDIGVRLVVQVNTKEKKEELPPIEAVLPF
jgi:formylglycine-generating enzyme